MRISKICAAIRRGSSERRGNALIELAFLMPWLLLLFAGSMDMGFYAYALVVTENAARSAALYTSSNMALADDADGACQYALGEMASLPNTRTLTTCNEYPVRVAASGGPGPDGEFMTTVSVTYRTVPLFALPFLPGQLTITRTSQMRVNTLS